MVLTPVLPADVVHEIPFFLENCGPCFGESEKRLIHS
jgi:hypothetical protein